MRCPRCRHENRAAAKFCDECAEPLTKGCSNCASAVSTTATVCPECAHPLVVDPGSPRFISPDTYTPKRLAAKILSSRAALEGERKQVTVLFADLTSSMELLADRNPEESRGI